MQPGCVTSGTQLIRVYWCFTCHEWVVAAADLEASNERPNPC